MKSLQKVLLAALLFAGTTGAYADTQDRHLSGFHAVQISASFDVYITQGGTESVKVDAPSDVIDKIITEVDGGVLKIRTKDNIFNWGSWFNNSHKKILIYVAVKDINAVGISGSSDVFFKEGLHADKFELKISGSGDVTGKLEVKTLQVSVSGSGDIKLAGSAETSNVSLSGSGDYEARDLTTSTTAVRISGSGDASVNASQKLDAHVSGSGDINYSGHPKQVSKSTSGSGDIHGS